MVRVKDRRRGLEATSTTVDFLRSQPHVLGFVLVDPAPWYRESAGYESPAVANITRVGSYIHLQRAAGLAAGESIQWVSGKAGVNCFGGDVTDESS